MKYWKLTKNNYFKIEYFDFKIAYDVPIINDPVDLYEVDFQEYADKSENTFIRVYPEKTTYGEIYSNIDAQLRGYYNIEHENNFVKAGDFDYSEVIIDGDTAYESHSFEETFSLGDETKIIFELEPSDPESNNITGTSDTIIFEIPDKNIIKEQIATDGSIWLYFWILIGAILVFSLISLIISAGQNKIKGRD